MTHVKDWTINSIVKKQKTHNKQNMKKKNMFAIKVKK